MQKAKTKMHQISKSCALVPSCLSNWRREGDISVGSAALCTTALLYTAHCTQNTAKCTAAHNTAQCTTVTQSEPFQIFHFSKTLQQWIVVFQSFKYILKCFWVFLSVFLSILFSLHILVLYKTSASDLFSLSLGNVCCWIFLFCGNALIHHLPVITPLPKMHLKGNQMNNHLPTIWSQLWSI